MSVCQPAIQDLFLFIKDFGEFKKKYIGFYFCRISYSVIYRQYLLPKVKFCILKLPFFIPFCLLYTLHKRFVLAFPCGRFCPCFIHIFMYFMCYQIYIREILFIFSQLYFINLSLKCPFFKRSG